MNRQMLCQSGSQGAMLGSLLELVKSRDLISKLQGTMYSSVTPSRTWWTAWSRQTT